jgi:hypothetical protein
VKRRVHRRNRIVLFLSSPSGLEAEHRCILDEVQKLNKPLALRGARGIKVVRFPNDIGAGAADYAQYVINAQSANLDILLCVVGPRMGTPTPRANSGTEEEFDRAIEEAYRGRNVPILLFFSDRAVRLGSIDPYQLLLVKAFKERAHRLGVLFHTYGSLHELRRRVRLSLRRAYRVVTQVRDRQPVDRRSAGRHRVVRLDALRLSNKLAPQAVDVRQVPIAEYRGKDLKLAGRIVVESEYFRFGFKYYDSREPIVSPGSILTQGQNLLIHIGRNTQRSGCFLTYYRAGIRLEPNHFVLPKVDLAKPVRFVLAIHHSGLVTLRLNDSLVFEKFFQLDGIPSLALMGWGDEHQFSCRINHMSLTVQF